MGVLKEIFSGNLYYMKLHYWVGKNGLRNFGDSLNEIIWSEKLPGVFNKQSNHLFLGIGTILNNKLPVAKNITVLGSGVGYGSIPEKMSEWHILSVRGPLTASALKIDPSLSITDPAVLVRNIKFLKNRPQFNFSYMPHWQNDNILFKNICCKLRINYISPLRDVRYIIDQILRSRNLITEAMHGAIVADAFRIPWVCVHDTRNPSYLPFKWRDWSSSISVPYSPNITPVQNKQ